MRNCIQHMEHFYTVGILLLEYLFATYYWITLLVSFNLIQGLLICFV